MIVNNWHYRGYTMLSLIWDSTSVFYFNYFRYCRKRSLLECRSHLHPDYRWKFIYSSKFVYFHSKHSDTKLIAIEWFHPIYYQKFSQKNFYHFRAKNRSKKMLVLGCQFWPFRHFGLQEWSTSGIDFTDILDDGDSTSFVDACVGMVNMGGFVILY